MKAGIYQTPNGNLIYVRKDRTIAATTLSPSSWPGTKVTTEANGARVVIKQTEYVCHRVADVPNGCTDPQSELTRAQMRLYPQPEVAQEDIKTIHDKMAADGVAHVAHDEYMLSEGSGKSGFATGGFVGLGPNEVPAILSRGHWVGAPPFSNFARQTEVITDWINDTAMRANGYRPCHAQSARKHRKQGHTVISDGARPGAYWWRAPLLQVVRRALTNKKRIR